MSSESDFAYSLKYNTHFIIKNITGTPLSQLNLAGYNPSIPPPYQSYQLQVSPQKTISVFHYPINAGETRDLLQIPGVQEEDIRSSLLKGQLRHKFLCGDIALVSSNIDLLQFSDRQRDWLQSYGFTEGVTIGFDELDGYVQGLFGQGGGGGGVGVDYLFRNKQTLTGAINGANRTFTVPSPDKFINGTFQNNVFKIYVTHNGHGMKENLDYKIFESGGVGTGFDTIVFISFTPLPNRSILEASYVIAI